VVAAGIEAGIEVPPLPAVAAVPVVPDVPPGDILQPDINSRNAHAITV
jgi:hypothetical protein